MKDDVDVEELLDFLKNKSKWIDGVCLTGGETDIASRLFRNLQEGSRHWDSRSSLIPMGQTLK